MRHYSTGRAQAATDGTSPILAPGPVPMSSRSAQVGVTALHGVMTGLANLVNEQLGRLTIGPQATRFLRHLERQTFGNAGLHRRAGRPDPGLWCPYVHAEWAAALELSASALTHLRTRLVEAGMLWYTPDTERRGQGAVGWSFDFAAWSPPRWGGARSGAGRPRATRSTAVNAHAAERPIPQNTIQDVNELPAVNPADEIKMSTKQFQDVNERQSRRQRAPFKMSTKRQAGAASVQESAVPARRGAPQQEGNEEENKKQRSTDADASGVTGTPHTPAALTPSHPDPSLAETPMRTTPPRRTRSPTLAARGTRLAVEVATLPPALPYETLRSYWLRIFREASATTRTEARSIVHAAARTFVGMGSARSDYILLGQLRQVTGSWATVLHWLLECGTRELADPRSYLRAIVTRQHATPTEQAPALQSDRQSARSGTGRVPSSHLPACAGPPGEVSTHPALGGQDEEEKAVAKVPDDALTLPRSASAVPEGAAAEEIDLSACVSAASLWQMARQRLRADVTAAQYSSWLVGTDLVRAPDGTYILLTRTTFAAEHISRLWGQRIAWILREITGRPCVLTTERRRLDPVPDG